MIIANGGIIEALYKLNKSEMGILHLRVEPRRILVSQVRQFSD